MNKSKMFKTVKSNMHRDFTGKYGILINRDGMTIIVDEDSITDSELERLYKRYR